MCALLGAPKSLKTSSLLRVSLQLREVPRPSEVRHLPRYETYIDPFTTDSRVQRSVIDSEAAAAVASIVNEHSDVEEGESCETGEKSGMHLHLLSHEGRHQFISSLAGRFFNSLSICVIFLESLSSRLETPEKKQEFVPEVALSGGLSCQDPFGTMKTSDNPVERSSDTLRDDVISRDNSQ